MPPNYGVKMEDPVSTDGDECMRAEPDGLHSRPLPLWVFVQLQESDRGVISQMVSFPWLCILGPVFVFVSETLGATVSCNLAVKPCSYPRTQGCRGKRASYSRAFRSNHTATHGEGKHCSVLAGSRATPQTVSGLRVCALEKNSRMLNLIAGHSDKFSVY